MLSDMSAWDFCRAFSFLDILVSPSDLSFMKRDSRSEFFNQLQRPIVLVPVSPSFMMAALGPRREYPSKPWRRRSASVARWTATRCGGPWRRHWKLAPVPMFLPPPLLPATAGESCGVRAFLRFLAHRKRPVALVFPAAAIAILACAHLPFGRVLLPLMEYRVRHGRACRLHRTA